MSTLTATTRPDFANPLQRLAPGLALALLATWLAAQPWAARLGLSALPLAIVLGMLIGNLGYQRLQARADAGVGFAKHWLLRAGIVLFGMRITFQDIGSVGWRGVAIDALMLVSTLGLAVLLGRRWLRLDAQSAILIGAGSAICGAAAVLASAPVVRANPDKGAVAVATVVLFGALAMFGYPLLHTLLPGLTPNDAAYGVYVGSTVHEVAQVVVVARSVSEAAAAQAVIAKMMRVMMLAPFLLVLSVRGARGGGAAGGAAGRIVVPWFAVGFVAVAGANSLHLLPGAWQAGLLALDNLLLATAMAALGLGTRWSAIRRAGGRPMVLATVLFGWLVAGGALVNGAIGDWWD